MYQLKELNLACNHIKSLPVSLGKLIKLQQLKANGNKISEIPEEIGKCKSLKLIFFNENEIVGVPRELANCGRLETLRLQVRQQLNAAAKRRASSFDPLTPFLVMHDSFFPHCRRTTKYRACPTSSPPCP